MYLNLYEFKIPYMVKRHYYFNDSMDPHAFAKNLTRVNNIRFSDSSDLVWVELPDIVFDIVPPEAEQYKLEKSEIIEEKDDPKLFIGTFYRYLRKKFLDNGFWYKRGNNFIMMKDEKELESNKNIVARLTYNVSVQKMSDKYYAVILPRFSFMSKYPALKSKIKSSFLFNIKSGRSFPYISGIEDILTIDLGEKGQKEVSYPDNYYFNFSSEEAEKYGFSKEKHRFYQEIIPMEFKKISKRLSFLDEIINIHSPYNLPSDKKFYVNVQYKFGKGESNNSKDVFNFSFYRNNQILNVVFFFSSKKQFYEIQSSLNTLFRQANSVFYTTARALGFSKIKFIKDPETNTSIFLYDPETFEVEKKEFFENLEQENVMAIIILDKYLFTIGDLIRKFPSNLILQPILKEKLKKIQNYIIKSYVYKLGNFFPGCKPFILENLEDKKNTIYIGLDMSHDLESRRTNFSISALDNEGNIIYVNRHKNLPLNEKMNLDILETEYIKIIDKYKEKYSKAPEYSLLLRDGRFLEDLNILKNILNVENIKHSFIEINKNVKVNSYEDLKEWILIMDENRYIYYPKTFLSQKGVEINIVFNETNYTSMNIAKQIYSLTRMAHSTPYTNYKLPYPLHIVDKISLTDMEWTLYIPYKFDDYVL